VTEIGEAILVKKKYKISGEFREFDNEEFYKIEWDKRLWNAMTKMPNYIHIFNE